MGELSIWHWLVVLIVVMLLFGSGKVSNLMGDFAKGIKAFRHNMQDDADTRPCPPTVPELPAELSAGAPGATVAPAVKSPMHHEA